MSRRKGTFPLSHFEHPDQRAAIERELGVGLEPVRGSGKASPHTGKGAKRGPSKLEQRFGEHLDAMKAARVVAAWSYEPIRVVLPAKRATYKGDFLVRIGQEPLTLGGPDPSHPFDASHHLVLLEVKPRDGSNDRPYLRAASWLRVRLAAERLRDLVPVFLAWPRPASIGGWRYQRVEPAR